MQKSQQNQQNYGYDPELVKQLKNEIINDLKAQREWQENYYEDGPQMSYSKNYRRQYNPEMMQQMKKDIMKDMETRREMQEKYYEDFYDMDYGRYGRPFMGRGMGRGLGRLFGWCPVPPPMPRNRRPWDYDVDYDMDYDYMRGMGKNQYRRPVDYDWWTDWEEYENQRNFAMLRQTLRDELRQMNKTYQKMRPPKDPQVRMILSDLLQEARQQGMNINDVLQNLEMTNNPNYSNGAMGYKESILDRIGGPFKDVDRRSFGYGAGAALLGLSVLPSVGKSIKPLVRKAMEEFMDVYDNAQGVFSQAKEELEDIVAEATFNKMKDSVDTNAKGDPPTDK